MMYGNYDLWQIRCMANRHSAASCFQDPELYPVPRLLSSTPERPSALLLAMLGLSYDRLGKKRVQQAHFRAHADSDDDPLDSFSSPTRPIHQQSGAKSKSEDRPRRDQKPPKIPRSERLTLPDHKEPHLSPSLIHSNSVQQSSELGPSDVAPIIYSSSRGHYGFALLAQAPEYPHVLFEAISALLAASFFPFLSFSTICYLRG